MVSNSNQFFFTVTNQPISMRFVRNRRFNTDFRCSIAIRIASFALPDPPLPRISGGFASPPPSPPPLSIGTIAIVVPQMLPRSLSSNVPSSSCFLLPTRTDRHGPPPPNSGVAAMFPPPQLPNRVISVDVRLTSSPELIFMEIIT